ncbi:hypothetical protein M0722_12880 [Microbacterium sp. KSW4-16]|uniref:hypothetical protein n=1 Tax=Microbacterium aurugineum TaxID=2851642 RepID=UPI0020BF0814|nr:hypothetical protein [Microbacterium aurugineum]MCK8468090.1 hypothetical protein [Microbacterium aurugineum]
MPTNATHPSDSQPARSSVAHDDRAQVAPVRHPGRPQSVARVETGLHARDGRSPAPEPTPAMVHARIRRTAMVPAIITVPCPNHEAAAGEPCYRLGEGGARGVCGPRIEFCAERIKARIAQR